MSDSTHHTPFISFGKRPEDKLNHSSLQKQSSLGIGWQEL